jgi:hypothetical protein
MAYKIRMINEGEPMGAAKKKKKSKKRGKKSHKTAIARRGTAVATARATNPKRRKRRSNPGAGDIAKDLLPLMAGGLAASLAAGIASRIKVPVPVLGSASAMAGEPWNVAQYAAAGAAAIFLPKFAGKFIDAGKFRNGILAIIGYKLVGGFLAGKIPGNMLAGADDGAMQIDGEGQTWIRQGSQWLPMQGLVTANQLDGLQARGPLDADPEWIDTESIPMQGGESLSDLYGGGSYN